jgi:ATP synthase protein I
MSDDKNLDDEELHARLSRLNEALRKHDAPPPVAEDSELVAKGKAFGRAMSVGMNIVSEFVAAIIVGGFLGWGADRLLGTKPWLLIVFLGLGSTAGFWNISRSAKARNDANAEADK